MTDNNIKQALSIPHAGNRQYAYPWPGTLKVPPSISTPSDAETWLKSDDGMARLIATYIKHTGQGSEPRDGVPVWAFEGFDLKKHVVTVWFATERSPEICQLRAVGPESASNNDKEVLIDKVTFDHLLGGEDSLVKFEGDTSWPVLEGHQYRNLLVGGSVFEDVSVKITKDLGQGWVTVEISARRSQVGSSAVYP